MINKKSLFCIFTRTTCLFGQHWIMDCIYLSRTSCDTKIIFFLQIGNLYYNCEKYPLSPLKPRSLAFFHDTYLTIEVHRIRCTNHLHDSGPLTDVNPYFTTPGCRYYFKINSWWPIVTSSAHGPAASYCDVTMIHCSHGYLWTHDFEVDAS